MRGLSHCRCCVVLVCTLMIIGAPRASAAEPAAAPGDAELKSARWWREQAARFCPEVADADARSDAFYQLAYECGHAGDLAGAAAAADEVTNPQKGIYARTFVAKKYHELQKDKDAAAMLEDAREFAQQHEQTLTNFGHSHIVQTSVEIGMPDAAEEYIATIAKEVERQSATRNLLMAMAKNDLLDLQAAKLSDSEWSDVAYGYAQEGRVEETLAAVERFDDEQGHDRAFRSLVEKLIDRKQLDGVEPIIEKIANPLLKSHLKERYFTAWAREEPVDAIQARLGAAGTRAEKVGLYTELIPKLAAADRIEEAEKAIEEMVAWIKESPREEAVTKFGRFDDALAVATAKANYLVTAKALARLGRKQEANERVERAEKPILALEFENGLGKMMLLAGLINAKIEIGDLAGARRSLEEIDPPLRSTTADQLAAAFAKAGDATAAIEVARMIPADNKGRGHSYEKVAAVLIRAGNVDAARQLLSDLAATGDDAEAYRGVGAAMIESGKAVELHQWLAEMPGPLQKAFACIGAAEELRKAK